MFDELNNVLLELHAGCRRQTADEFKKWALDLASTVVPFEMSNWANAVVTDGMTHTFNVCSRGLDPGFNHRMSENSHLDTRLLEAYTRLGETLLRDALDPSDTSPKFHRIVLKPSCVRFAAMTMFMDTRTRVVDGIVLMRKTAALQFSEKERLLVQALVPHLHQTRIANQIERGSDILNEGLRASYHTLVCSNDGLVIASEEQASTKLLQQWPGWDGGKLPGDLTNTIKMAVSEYTAKRLGCTNVVAWVHPGQNQTLVRLREPNAIDTLGQREFTVAEQFATGSTYKEIAKTIGSSPSTVSNQLSSIYIKLGISNKSELARQLENWR